MDTTIHILRYMKGTPSSGLFYVVDSDLQLEGYFEVDWGSGRMTSRSFTGYCVFLGSSLVSWKTKKQRTISKLSKEAEYRSMSATTSKLVWTSSIKKDFLIHSLFPVPLYCNNKTAQYITANPVFHEHTKHLNIEYHYVRDKVAEGFFETSHVSSAEQLADLMTINGGSQIQVFEFKVRPTRITSHSTLRGNVEYIT